MRMMVRMVQFRQRNHQRNQRKNHVKVVRYFDYYYWNDY